MNLRVVILEAKVLADGKHKLRIAISHNSQTRYFPTRFVVPSTKNLKNGNVVGLDNASYINLQLRNFMNRIYLICDELEDMEYYTCSQLVDVIKHKLEKGHIRSFGDIAKEWLSLKSRRVAEDTLRLYRSGVQCFIDFAGADFILSMLDSNKIYDFHDYLKNKKGYSDTTINMRMGNLRNIVYFAQNHGYARYQLPPFYDYKEPMSVVRDVALSIEQIREIRDLEIADKWAAAARDIFMLSFYLCGMNLGDILVQNFNKDYVKFIRLKTKSRRRPNDFTEFTIQPEARAIIDKYITPDGHLQIHGRVTKKSIQHTTDDHLYKLSKMLQFDKRLIFYSARKSFAQIANELMVKDSVIEYCLGDAISNPKRALSFYIHVNRKMADSAIRTVFDALASDKSIDELLESI